MQKALYFIRKITTPPILATAFLLVLYFIQPSVFRSVWQLICGILFLGALPILGYPLQKYIPYFKDKGREGQRTLAMIFSVAGYLLGIITAAFAKASTELYVIYLDYLLSGIVILLLNKVFRFKASGHACGILAPVVLFMRLDDKGKIIAYSKVRGKTNAIKTTLDTMEKHARYGKDYSEKCWICHSNCPEDAEKTKQALKGRFPNIKGDIKICDIGTIIASHCGPGTVAVFFLGDDRTPDKAK